MRHTQSVRDLTFHIMLVDQVLQSISSLWINSSTSRMINCPNPKLCPVTIKINQNICEKPQILQSKADV